MSQALPSPARAAAPRWCCCTGSVREPVPPPRPASGRHSRGDAARVDSGWGCRDYRRTAMTEQAVRVERSGPVYTVFLHRPARRNAVDGPAAAELAAAFRAFDADPGVAVAVLHGEGGVFCSGADLTAIGTGRGNRVSPHGDAPMGVSRLRLSKPVIAAVAGYAGAGGLEPAPWWGLRGG